KKDYTRASIQFRNAAKVMPKDAEPYYQLALALFALRDYIQADRSLVKAVELHPKHKQAQVKLAERMATSDTPEVVKKAQGKVRDLLTTGASSAEILDILA